MAIFIIHRYHFPYNFSKSINYWRKNSRTPRPPKIKLNRLVIKQKYNKCIVDKTQQQYNYIYKELVLSIAHDYICF